MASLSGKACDMAKKTTKSKAEKPAKPAQKPGVTPCGGAAHADPNAPQTPEQRPLPEALGENPAATKSPAEWAYQRLILYIQNFEEQLDEEHEVAVGLAGGSTGVLRIEGIGYFDPDIITFYGANEAGEKTQLIQHVSQLSVTLAAMTKPAPQDAPRRIGFRLAENLKKG